MMTIDEIKNEVLENMKDFITTELTYSPCLKAGDSWIQNDTCLLK